MLRRPPRGTCVLLFAVIAAMPQPADARGREARGGVLALAPPGRPLAGGTR